MKLNLFKNTAMNKYYVKIPYSYMRYGHLTCYVYAEDEEEAEDLAREYQNRHDEDYDDGDDTGDAEYDYSDMSVELEEEDIELPPGISNSAKSAVRLTPPYFLAEIHSI